MQWEVQRGILVGVVTEGRGTRLRRKLSLHHLRKRRHIGSEEPRVPPTTKLQNYSANGGLEGYWKHPALEPGREGKGRVT
eukprot:889495-Pelagomonas_calceolata.AAC.1